MPDRIVCTECGKYVTPTKDGIPRMHGPAIARCPGGAQPQPKGPEAKAERYLAEGRVKVVELEESSALIEVQGSREKPYRVKWTGEAWVCDCESRIYRCTHVICGQSLIAKKEEPTPTPTPELTTAELDEIFGAF